MRSLLPSLRLRTLPLSLSSVIVGVFLALRHHCFSWPVVFFLVLTTLCLQILANLANEWGDWRKGTDVEQTGRKTLGLQSGKLSEKSILTAIVVTACLAVLFGVMLLYVSFVDLTNSAFWIFLALGALCIVTAVSYTVGRRAFGYHGLGDLAVFLFFGWVGVCGSAYLLTHRVDYWHLLPASAMGLLITAVLNLNNVRDLENDRIHHKITFALWLCMRFCGKEDKPAKVYLTIQIVAAYLCALVFAWFCNDTYYFLLTIPLADIHLFLLWNSKGATVDKSFKVLVLCTLLFALSYALF